MPSYHEVHPIRMAACWLVLPTNSPGVPKLVHHPVGRSHTQGDTNLEVIVLMMEREGKQKGQSQLYGSQIHKGERHELSEPNNVNQSRSEMGIALFEVRRLPRLVWRSLRFSAAGKATRESLSSLTRVQFIFPTLKDPPPCEQLRRWNSVAGRSPDCRR